MADTVCMTCGESMRDDAGAHYHKIECRRRKAYAEWQKAIEDKRPPNEIKRLEKRHDELAYTGD